MKDKKGFTLIELLAVIVILAIIMVIAIPQILKVIEESKKSAAKSSALGYIKAINYNNKFAEAGEDGYTLITSGNVSGINVNINGDRPTSGNVTINVAGKVSAASLCIQGYNVTYNGTSATVGNKCGAPAPAPVSFATDSWETIAENTTSSVYSVGDTKCVALTGFTTTNNNGCSSGEFKVRIANKTACTTETSQTACGFVVEFVDVVATHNMNPTGEYKGQQYSNGWNVDGYPASSMYNEYFANNATNPLFDALPSELQNVIINTIVVSSHGSTTGETNFTSTDKLYLLSTKEVGLDVNYDSATTETRTLDYYDTNNNNESRLKKGNKLNKTWWLRSADSTRVNVFCSVSNSGGNHSAMAYNAAGVSPAFRIGIN